MKNKIQVLFLVCFMLMLTGCGSSNYIVDENKKIVTNPETGQNLQTYIYCKPSDNTKMYEIYEKYEDQLKVKLDKLPECDNFKVTSNKTKSLWQFLFVKPVAYIILKLGKVFKNMGATKAYLGISLMVVGIVIRLITLPLNIKMQKQSKNLQKIQPEMERLERKYANRTDQESMMMKSQEMMGLYKKYKVNPFVSCLISLIQLPIFFAFLQAIYKIPAIYEGKIFGWNLGTTPSIGIGTYHNYSYLILVILIGLTTFFSFKITMSQSTGAAQNNDAANQTKTMLYFMTVFITFASLTLPTAIALYWIVSYAFVILQTLITSLVKKLKAKKEITASSKKIKEKLKAKEGLKYGKNK